MPNGPIGALSAWLENKRRVAGRNLTDMVQSPGDFAAMASPRTQEAMETSMTPEGAGGWLSGGLGIIAPAKLASEVLGIERVTDRALDMFKSGRGQQRIAEESIGALRQMRNPGGAESVYIGPDGHPRVVISNEHARLAGNAPVREMPSGRYRDGYVENLIPEGGAVSLSDILLHPSLYDISSKAAMAKVTRMDPLTDFLNNGAMAYNPSANLIQFGQKYYPNTARRNDPLGYLRESLLHEGNHAIQEQAGLRTGASDRASVLRKQVQEARDIGSYQSTDDLNNLDKLLQAGAEGKFSDKDLDSLLVQSYLRNYGEAEARAGSEYVPGVTPYRYLKNTW